MWRVGALLLTAWLGDPQRPTAEAALSVEIAPELHCPSGTEVMGALERQLAPMRVVRGAEVRERFHLRLRPYGDHGVALTLYEGAARLVERVIEVKGRECQGLAQAVALITTTWAKSSDAGQDEQPTPTPPSPAPPPPILPSAPAPVVASDSQVAPTAVQPESDVEQTKGEVPPNPRPPVLPAVIGPKVKPAKPAKPVKTAKPASEPAPAQQEPVADAPAKEEARAVVETVPAVHGMRLEAAVGTTLSLDGPTLPTVTGRLGVEGARDRWLLGLRGQVESSQTLTSDIAVRHAQIELACGAEVVRTARFHAAALAGAGVDLISSRASNHEHDELMRSYTPTLIFALRAGIAPHPRFDVFAASELVVGLWRENFVSDDRTLASTARSRTRLLVGVSWHVF